MALVDLTVDNSTSRGYGKLGNYDVGFCSQIGTVPSVVSRTITCTSTYTLLASSKEYKMFIIPAGTYVKSVTAILLTAEGATGTIDIGDSGSGTQYLSNFDLNGTAGTSTTSAVGAGKYYASADYIIADPDNDLDTASFCLVIEAYRI